MYSEDCGEIWVCDDCMVAREGDGNPDRPVDLPDEWGLIGFGYTMAAGGEHADGCPNGIDGPRDTDCDCDRIEFTWSACEGCGLNLGGSRSKYTVWRMSEDEARAEHKRAIAAQRWSTDSRFRANMLHAASLWRTYLADRFAERHRFERWLARNVAA